MKHAWIPIVLIFGTFAAPLPAAGELPVLTAALYAADEDAAAADESYRAGRRALDEGRWSDAASYFSQSAAGGSSYADGAHYWRAYALHKDGRSAEALEVLGELRRGYRGSSWLDDAQALELEIREGAGGARLAEQADGDLKLMALGALMNSDSERALPLLMKFIEGDHPPELRERALFVLSQHESAEAAERLLELARGGRSPELQMQAVQYLGMSEAPGSGEALAEIYRATGDREVKAAVLQGFMISDQHEPLLELARSEPDAELRRAAIQQLGVMDATQALRELYASESSAEVKAQILESMFIGDDTSGLLEIVRTESDEELRRAGIRSLGLVDSDEASSALVEIYGQSKDAVTREAIIEAFFLSDDASELIQVARTETDPGLRKTAFERLSLMDDEAALDFMMEILEN